MEGGQAQAKGMERWEDMFSWLKKRIFVGTGPTEDPVHTPHTFPCNSLSTPKRQALMIKCDVRKNE